MNIKKIKILNFSLLPVLLLAILFFVSIAKKNDVDVDYAKKMTEEVKKMRIAIDNYYLKTGTFPDFTGNDLENNLVLIKFENTSGEKINFKEIYGANSLMGTPKFKNLNYSNRVNNIEDFKLSNNDGGWNYNKRTGEIHLNLPYNFFNQGIDWNTF